MSYRRSSKAPSVDLLIANMTWEHKLQFCWCAGGIIASLMVYSVLQVS